MKIDTVGVRNAHTQNDCRTGALLRVKSKETNPANANRITYVRVFSKFNEDGRPDAVLARRVLR